jgi:hypothetical protein
MLTALVHSTIAQAANECASAVLKDTNGQNGSTRRCEMYSNASPLEVSKSLGVARNRAAQSRKPKKKPRTGGAGLLWFLGGNNRWGGKPLASLSIAGATIAQALFSYGSIGNYYRWLANLDWRDIDRPHALDARSPWRCAHVSGVKFSGRSAPCLTPVRGRSRVADS